VNPDFVFIVNYECPRCHVALENRSSGAPAWLRCPACGRASMPPDHERNAGPPRSEVDPFLIGVAASATASLPLRPRPMAPMPAPMSTRNQTARLMLGSGFFLTMFLFIFSLLESNGFRAAMFGVAAAVFLFLLTRPVSRIARDPSSGRPEA